VEIGIIGMSYTLDDTGHIVPIEGCDEDNPTFLRLMFTKDNLEKFLTEIQEKLKDD
jgi:hypothetical protein